VRLVIEEAVVRERVVSRALLWSRGGSRGFCHTLSIIEGAGANVQTSYREPRFCSLLPPLEPRLALLSLIQAKRPAQHRQKKTIRIRQADLTRWLYLIYHYTKISVL